MTKRIRISLVGCCLVDRLYNNISFYDPSFSTYLSKKRRDGGLTPGQLVFKEEFEDFCQEKFSEVLKKFTKDRKPGKVNIGGPGIVPLIHANQMFHLTIAECLFYGCGADDADGEFILSVLRQMDLPEENYTFYSGFNTPATIVLSDPFLIMGMVNVPTKTGVTKPTDTRTS